MKAILLFLGTGLLLSCGKNDSPVRKKLRGCDSLVITFNVPGTDSITNTVSTTDTKAIQQMARYLDGKASDKKDCGFDGNMQFFKAGTPVLPVVFRYSQTDCRLFTFDLDNTLMRTALSKEAADFLQSLSENKSLY
ncbi:MAG: hypothetical protein U0U70_03235 [Chitinophagaceae bacterium]